MANGHVHKCALLIPNTFIMCGEGDNYCSDQCLMESRRLDAKCVMCGRGLAYLSARYCGAACCARHEMHMPPEYETK